MAPKGAGSGRGRNIIIKFKSAGQRIQYLNGYMVLLTLIMPEVSIISTIKVLNPLIILSLAPTRPSMESTMLMVAMLQGTKAPTWAIRTAVPTERMYVLLPPIFGPVIIYMLHLSVKIQI